MKELFKQNRIEDSADVAPGRICNCQSVYCRDNWDSAMNQGLLAGMNAKYGFDTM